MLKNKLFLKKYEREAAVAYALRWKDGRNPEYFNFDVLCGDDTSFVSQCIYAGSGVMNYTKVSGWYYMSTACRSAAWSGAQYLYEFFIQNKGEGPYGCILPPACAVPGDILQIRDTPQDPYDTMLVTANDNGEKIFICGHTLAVRPAFIDPCETAFSLRCIHILGVRAWESSDRFSEHKKLTSRR